MKEILTSCGQWIVLDDEDYERFKNFTWTISVRAAQSYALRRYRIRGQKKSKMMYLHKEIMPNILGLVVDHINGNTLDNRKENLRLISHRQNTQNRHHKKSSKYVGVCWNKRERRWQPAIWYRGESRVLGRYKNELEAATMYRVACVHLLGYDPYEVLTPSMQREREALDMP